MAVNRVNTCVIAVTSDCRTQLVILCLYQYSVMSINRTIFFRVNILQKNVSKHGWPHCRGLWAHQFHFISFIRFQHNKRRK